MPDLTDKQKEECQKIIDKLTGFWWNSLELRMNDGLSFEAALNELMGNSLNGESNS